MNVGRSRVGRQYIGRRPFGMKFWYNGVLRTCSRVISRIESLDNDCQESPGCCLVATFAFHTHYLCKRCRVATTALAGKQKTKELATISRVV